MAITDAGSKEIYLEELEAEYGASNVNSVIAEKAARVITKTINRILLEELEILAGSFAAPNGPVTGTGAVQ